MTFRQALRAGTSRQHQILDTTLSRLDLTQRESYILFLRIQSAALLPLEASLEHNNVQGVLADWPRRARSVALTRDLAMFGEVPAAPVDVPTPMTENGIFGVLYVLEGSRLGGEVLLRRVRQAEAKQLRAATAFLDHGNEVSLWGSFLLALEARSMDEQGQADMISAAQETFQSFIAAAERMLGASVSPVRLGAS